MLTASHPLLERYAALKDSEPNLRIRDAAARLGVSEAALVAAQISLGTVTRLKGPFGELIKRLPELGRVMCLARNEAIVHERKGRYETVELFGPMGQVVGPDIDLRLFLSQWAHGYALVEPQKDDVRRSLQFFDPHGVAIQKVYLEEEGDAAAFDALVAAFTNDDQSPEFTALPAPEPKADPADGDVDAAGFQSAWDAMTDTHEFFAMLRKFGVGREQSLRMAGPERARAVEPASVRTLLQNASASANPIMIFVGNRGILQIHTGPVKNIKIMGPWLNVLDPEFNLHLREDLVARAWVVKKATKDGHVTSLELFDAAGENLALFFGKRKPGQKEEESWRDLVNAL